MKSSVISVKNTSQTSKKHKNTCNIQLDRQHSPNFSLVHKADYLPIFRLSTAQLQNSQKCDQS